MKEYLQNKLEMINFQLKEVQKTLDYHKQPIYKIGQDGNLVDTKLFRYGDDYDTHADSTVRNLLVKRNKLQRKARRIKKKL